MNAVVASGPRKRGSLTLWLGLLLVCLHVAVALLTLVWTPYDPTALTGGRRAAPSGAHRGGTPPRGGDLLNPNIIG